MSFHTRTIITNFTSGQLSPRMRGRVDLDQYQNGAAVLQNFMVLPQGGATRRPGLAFAGLAADQNNRCRLIPFVVSDLTTYVLELGNQYIRFWRNRGPVTDGSGHPLQLASPWLTPQLRAITTVQSADVLYMCHVATRTQKLQRVSPTAFTLTPVSFANGPYDADNTGDIGAPGFVPATSAGSMAAPAPGAPTTIDGTPVPANFPLLFGHAPDGESTAAPTVGPA